jgi:transcriptional regulator with XRE-family HTH domain
MEVVSLWQMIAMNYPKRLVTIHKQQGYTQQSLADAVGLHVNQIKKYEAGTTQPTLKAMVSLAKTLLPVWMPWSLKRMNGGRMKS